MSLTMTLCHDVDISNIYIECHDIVIIDGQRGPVDDPMITVIAHVHRIWIIDVQGGVGRDSGRA